MASSGVFNNIEAVKEAMKVYGIMVKNDAHEGIRMKMADIAYRASEYTPYGDRAKIRSEISSLPITKDGGKKRYGDTQYVGQYKLINWERKLKGLLPLGNSKFRKVSKYRVRPGAMSVEERIIKRRNTPRNTGPSHGISRFMDGKYKAFIKARQDSVNFLRVAWAPAAEFFGKPFQRGRDLGPKAISRFTGVLYGGKIKDISGDIREYSMFNGAGKYDTRRKKPGQDTAPERSKADQEKAANILELSLQKAVEFVFSDMLQFFETRARRYQSALRVLNKVK